VGSSEGSRDLRTDGKSCQEYYAFALDSVLQTAREAARKPFNIHISGKHVTRRSGGGTDARALPDAGVHD
jgi:hypothetical protein